MKMLNKISLEQEKVFLEDGIYYLNVDSDCKLDINVKENSTAKIIIIGKRDYDINYLLNENSELIVNSLNKDNSVNIEIILEKNSKLTYHHSVLGIENSLNNFNIIHKGNDSISKIYNNGINRENNKLYFKIDGIVPKNLLNIVCSQSSKIINYNKGDSKIIPNLIIDSNDIMASHSAYIGNIDNDVKFYLESRGIEERNIKYLIYKSILLGKMDLSEEKEEFYKIIDEWW